MIENKEIFFEEWSEILWQSWANPNSDSQSLSAFELLEIFKHNALTRQIPNLIQDSELNFFQYLMKERDWDQALLLAYVDYGNIGYYFYDVCEIYVEHFMKLGEFAEVIITSFLNSKMGADFLEKREKSQYYLEMALEQLKTPNPKS